MMEPVAWMDDGTTRTGSETTGFRVVHADTKATMPRASSENFTVPLVRLSDAEARIKELQRERYELAYAITGGEDAPGLLDSVSVDQLVEIARGNHRSMSAEIDRSVAATARAEAAEALLKEVVTAWEVLPAWHHTARVVERWLANDMNPVIDKIRAAHAISGKIGGGE